jgi:hypothetical protein
MSGGPEQARARFGAAMAGAPNALAAADQLCHACVELLEVDGASISLLHEGATRGTFGSSGKLSRRLDELQFTFGEGPCLDAVNSGVPVLAGDFEDPRESRWPAFAGAVLEFGVSAVFALPVAISSTPIGALDLFRNRSGDLVGDDLTGGLLAAELAALPLLDLMTSDVDWNSAARGDDGWGQLASLERVEVYQATGMIMEAMAVGPTDALVRLRARAFARDMTASELAWAIVERRLDLRAAPWLDGRDKPEGGLE